MAVAAMRQHYGSYASFLSHGEYVRSIIIAELSEEQQRSLDDLPKSTGIEDASDIQARRELRVKTMEYVWHTFDRIKSKAFPEECAAEKKHEAARKEAMKELAKIVRRAYPESIELRPNEALTPHAGSSTSGNARSRAQAPPPQ